MTRKRKRPLELPATNVLDYPETMSGFEKESLAAEEKIEADRKKPPKPRKDLGGGTKRIR
jgi:hypothetical protein